MAYGITTSPPYVLPYAPRPAFRFTGDATVVMATQSDEPRYTSSYTPPPPPSANALKTESGDFIMTENNDNLQFEE